MKDLCINCAYHRRTFAGDMCAHSQLLSPVNGRVTELCLIARKYECRGNWFKPKPPSWIKKLINYLKT